MDTTFGKFQKLLSEMVKTRIPDIHIASESAPYIRRHNGGIVPIGDFGVMSQADVEEIILGIIGPERFAVYQKEYDYDCSYRYEDHRFRVNIFHDSRGYALAIRYIPTDIPSWQTLGIPQGIMDLLSR